MLEGKLSYVIKYSRNKTLTFTFFFTQRTEPQHKSQFTMQVHTYAEKHFVIGVTDFWYIILPKMHDNE